MYSEILDLIAGYENGFSKFLKSEFERLGRKLGLSEVNLLFITYDINYRSYINPIKRKSKKFNGAETWLLEMLYEKKAPKSTSMKLVLMTTTNSLGDRSMDLEQRLEDNKEVF